VLVVEDDPLVSDVCRKFFESREEFEVAGVVRSGEDALQFLRRWPCHLLLLDLKLAGVSGVKVLQRLRAENVPVEVIAVTATRKAAVVRTVIQAGAISYLVKPFDIERLHQALDLFLTRMSALEGDDLDQGAIDDACASNGLARRHPKGLTVEGLARIRDVLRGEAEPIDSAAIGSRVGMSRVTARRYLEYLVRTNQAACHSEPSGRGRPRKLYTAVELTQGAPSAA
jgi:response regulator of citrate/malate metabolism